MGATVRLACIIISDGRRRSLVETKVLPSVLPQGFDEVIVVGDHCAGERYRYLHVPPLTNTTTDALVKRDVGTLAANCDYLTYLCDDHALHWDFATQVRAFCGATWDVLVPSRWVEHPSSGRIQIPMGEAEGYCGGHGGVFRRWVIEARPWTTMPHHRLWDVLSSQEQLKIGARFVYVPSVAIEDLEPENRPWL